MRSSGILMHISSLPSKYGIGTLGEEAFSFVDFLSDSNQKLWQILPITPTSYGDSPYQSFSTFAGNPYFIDLDLLEKEGLLLKEEYENEVFSENDSYVDYGILYNVRFKILYKAFLRFIKNPAADFSKFKEENSEWLYDYALFMALKTAHGGISWQEFPKALKFREEEAMKKIKAELKDDIEFWAFLQYKFFEQWKKLKAYANKKGVQIIGDLPIYVALDSADVWSKPELFKLDKDLNPKEVAGCPPDYFAEKGQLWGNPIYNWTYHRMNDFSWWLERIKKAKETYDIVRIDHFRGFAGYYAIPGTDETAENGEWKRGPGMDLFKLVKEKLDNPKIIAEDLGYITDDVRELLEESGYPGMKVLQFGFTAGQDSEHLPHNYNKNCVCYIGTHDNDTTKGWLFEQNSTDVEYILNYLGIKDQKDIPNGLIRLALSSSADTVIVTIQDYLGLGSEARMNFPSKPCGNWTFRVKKEQLSKELSKKINKLSQLYWR